MHDFSLLTERSLRAVDEMILDSEPSADGKLGCNPIYSSSVLGAAWQ